MIPKALPRSLLVAGTFFWSTPNPALGQVSFTSGGAVAIGNGPYWVAVGDFNRDGVKDLATPNRGGNDVSVLLGNGDGTFQAARSFLAGGGPVSVAVGDFNRDGVSDLVTADYNSATVSVLRGVGDGSFLPPQSFPAGGTNPNCVAVGELNGDGVLDLAVAIFGGNEPTSTTAAVLLGTGTGTFQAPQAYAAQRGPLWVAVGEFNGDGVQDLAVANFGVDTISVLLGNGNGTFRAALNFHGGSGAAAVVVGELNSDGRQDLAIVDYREPYQVLVVLGNGDGTFGAPRAFPVGPSPATAAMADFNGDGVQDLAVPNWNFNTGNTVSVLVGNGDGTFQAAQTVLAGGGVLGVAAEDITGDGRPDLALSNYSGNTVSILINDGGAPATHTLTVSKSGTGSGTVTSSPAGIQCGSSCSAGYSSGTVVTLTASAAGGSTFSGWSGSDCSGTGTCSVTMNAATTVTATFTAQPQQFSLTVDKTGTGSGTVTSSPTGIDCGANCGAVYDSGTVVTLSAAPASGSSFGGWSGGGCTGTGTCSVTMNAATTVTATFTAQPQQFSLMVNKTGTGSGTVTSSPTGINCGANCGAVYDSGTVVTLSAAPAGGSSFGGWSGGGCTGTGTCSVTMNAARTVTARFTRPQFTLTVSKAGTGNGSVTSSPAGINCGGTCSAAYTGGTPVTLSAVPASGSTFAGWSGGCLGPAACALTMNADTSVAAIFASLGAPVLKWQYGGCTTWCQTGWYASPAVVDLDADGQPDVVWGSYDVVALNGANGSLKWRRASGNRVWPGIAVADLTGDGGPEIIVGRSGDEVSVYNRAGGLLWTRRPFGGGEVRSLAVSDLEADGQLEIVVGSTQDTNGARQMSVYRPNGAVRSGWPARHAGDPGYGGGMYNENVAVADMDGDGFAEVFGLSGGHYITALDRSGNQLAASAVYNNISPLGPKAWSQVGVHVDHVVDVRGYADCGLEHRPDFGASAPVVADVDGNGMPELIAVGSVYDCGRDPYTDLYHVPFIFRLDRTRWSGSGFDWTVLPRPGAGSAPRSEDYDVIEAVVPNPAVADLDGDGLMEIVYPSYDGKVHAYWLDKAEHGSWPYVLPTSRLPGDTFRFASEPVVADLDNDGHAEVLFTSWPRKATGGLGQLHVLDSHGRELFRIPLPAAMEGGWNGGLGAPTLANIDADPDLEVVVGTVASGVVAYDLPGTANARVLWATGRGNPRRTGTK